MKKVIKKISLLILISSINANSNALSFSNLWDKVTSGSKDVAQKTTTALSNGAHSIGQTTLYKKTTKKSKELAQASCEFLKQTKDEIVNAYKEGSAIYKIRKQIINEIEKCENPALRVLYQEYFDITWQIESIQIDIKESKDKKFIAEQNQKLNNLKQEQFDIAQAIDAICSKKDTFKQKIETKIKKALKTLTAEE